MQRVRAGGKGWWLSALGVITWPCGAAEGSSAIEHARVVSRTPVLEQRPMSSEVCRAETPGVQPSKAGMRVITTRRCVTGQEVGQRLVGYDVVYELDGQTYRIRLDRDPGETLAVQVARSAPTVYASPLWVREGLPSYADPRVILPAVGVHYVYVAGRRGSREGDRARSGERRKRRHGD